MGDGFVSDDDPWDTDDTRAVRERLAALEADPANEGNPLMGEVRWLAEKYLHLAHQFERVTRISDRQQYELRETNRELAEETRTDALTGLPNRRAMEERLEAEAARAAAGAPGFAVAMADLDRFKTINDRHGHEAGDAVLERVGRALADGLRGYDIVARWGGEEFLVLFPGADADAAHEAAERLRRAVADLAVPWDDTTLTITISVGVTPYRADDTGEICVARADDALYTAKEQGRNRVVVEA